MASFDPPGIGCVNWSGSVSANIALMLLVGMFCEELSARKAPLRARARAHMDFV